MNKKELVDKIYELLGDIEGEVKDNINNLCDVVGYLKVINQMYLDLVGDRESDIETPEC